MLLLLLLEHVVKNIPRKGNILLAHMPVERLLLPSFFPSLSVLGG